MIKTQCFKGKKMTITKKTRTENLATKKRRTSRRNILRGTKTAWIFFCNSNRKRILNKNPDMSFGDVCKELAPQWKALSDEEKRPYIDLHEKDKKRFIEESANLTDEQKRYLKQHKKQKRELKKQYPKPGLSPYMFFVIDKRQEVVAQSPGASFQLIGKLLGTKWNNMSSDDKRPYVEKSQKDKLRYVKEFEYHKKVSEKKD